MLINLCCAATICIAAQQALSHVATNVAKETVGICHPGLAGSEKGMADLASLGWDAVDRTNLSDTAIAAFAARRFSLRHVDFTPDARGASAWERAKFNSTGERRYKKPDNDELYSLVYQLGAEAGFLEVINDMHVDQEQKSRQFVLPKNAEAAVSSSFPKASELPTPIHVFPKLNLPGGTLQLTLHDNIRIESAIGEEFPVWAYIRVVSK